MMERLDHRKASIMNKKNDHVEQSVKRQRHE